MRIVPHSVTLLHSTPDPERLVEKAVSHLDPEAGRRKRNLILTALSR